MTTQSHLLDTIQGLDEPTAMEAAQLLGTALDATPESDEEEPIVSAPLQHKFEVAEMCRLLLTLAATDPDMVDLVEESIEGAGRKQLVLGGLEIVALAALALGAIQVCFSRGREAEEEIMTVERRPDGTTVTTIRKTVKFGLSAQIAQLVGNTLGLPLSAGTEEQAPSNGAGPG